MNDLQPLPIKRHRPERTEVIEWKDPAAEMPDSESTVLLCLEDDTGREVEAGFHDGEEWLCARCWRGEGYFWPERMGP